MEDDVLSWINQVTTRFLKYMRPTRIREGQENAKATYTHQNLVVLN